MLSTPHIQTQMEANESMGELSELHVELILDTYMWEESIGKQKAKHRKSKSQTVSNDLDRNEKHRTCLQKTNSP